MIDREQFDDLLSARMARYDEALTGDTAPPDWDEPVTELDPELATEWEQAKSCLELLDRARRGGLSIAGDLSAGAAFSGRDAAVVPRQLGRFRIERELGRGGLGIVYLAHDPQLSRKVALKIPRVDIVAHGDGQRRFLREAEAASRLSHPNIVSLYEVGEDGTTCYLACEYCTGPTLSQWLRRRSEPVDARQAATIVLRLAEAVEHAHSRGVLHRDIKPGNVMLSGADDGPPNRVSADDEDFIPKLTDFGLAKLTEQAGGETRTGAVLGTLAYMSPEQAEGRLSELDSRTDVYALGAILYELLTGAAPYLGKGDADTLRRLLLGELVAPRCARPELSRDLEAITMKCLAGRPADRYATAHEVALDLSRFLAGEPTVARPIAAWERVLKWTRRRPAVAALVAVSTVAAISLLGVGAIYSARLEVAHGRSRQLLYAADMQTGFDAYGAGHLPTVRQRLDRYRAAAGGEDLQTFTWRLLDKLSNADQQTLYDHTAPVLSLACSPDGSLSASGGRDYVIRLWDNKESRSWRELRGHTEDINSLTFSPDGGLLASASDDHTVRIWSTNSLAPVRVLTDFSDLSVYGVAFSPDGRNLVVGSEDTKIRVWNTTDWTLVQTWAIHTARVNRVSFSADGSRMASCSQDGTVQVLAFPSGDVMSVTKVARTPSHGVDCLAMSPDGRRVVAASIADRAVTILASDTGRKWSTNIADDHSVYNLAFSPDGRLIAAGLRSGSVRVWDTSTNHIVHMLLGHQAAVRGVAFSPDGKSLLTGGIDGLVKRWDLPAIDQRETHRPTADGVRALAFQPAGRMLAFAETTGEVVLVDTRSGQTVLSVQPGGAAPRSVVNFSADGQLFAYPARAGEELHLLDVQSRQLRHRLPTANGRVTAAEFINGGRQILVADDSSRLTKWDVTSGKELTSVHTDQSEIFSIDSFERRGLVATVDERGAQLRDRETLQVRQVLPPFLDKLHGAAAASPDESLLVAGTATGKVVVWDLRAGGARTDLVGHDSLVHGVAFCPDGTTFATCGVDDLICLWDVSTLQPVGDFNIQTFAGPAAEPFAIGFSPDGTTLVVAGERADWGMVRSWCTSSGESSWKVNQSSDDFSAYDCIIDDRRDRCLEVPSDLIVDTGSRHGAALHLAPGSQAKFNATTAVGSCGEGQLTVGRGVRVDSNDDFSVGQFVGSNGTVTLDDGVMWRSKRNVQIGDYGRGELSARGGTTIECRKIIVGYESKSNGVGTLEGVGTSLNSAENVVVGGLGTGVLNLLSGASLQAVAGVTISDREGSRGTVTATGQGTSLVADGFYIGVRDRGTLDLLDGARLECREMCLAERARGNGEVTVKGNGAGLIARETIVVAGDQSRDFGSPAKLTVGRDSTVEAGGKLQVWNRGTVCLDGGTLKVGTIDMTQAATLEYRGGQILCTGLAQLNGRLDVSNCAAVVAGVGGRVPLLSFRTRSGAFQSIQAPPGLVVTPEYGEHGLELLVSAQSAP